MKIPVTAEVCQSPRPLVIGECRMMQGIRTMDQQARDAVGVDAPSSDGQKAMMYVLAPSTREEFTRERGCDPHPTSHHFYWVTFD